MANVMISTTTIKTIVVMMEEIVVEAMWSINIVSIAVVSVIQISYFLHKRKLYSSHFYY